MTSCRKKRCAGKLWWLFGAWLLLASACAPTIAPQLRRQIDKDLSFAVLAADPEAQKGKVVLLGGTIIQTVPKPGLTEMEILQKPLDYFDEPRETDRSEGRFLVLADGFLDPAIYRKDRKITVVGEVVGSEVRRLEALDYRYPVLKAKSLKLWPKLAAPPPPYWGPYPWGPYYWGAPWYPWWGPYWWP